MCMFCNIQVAERVQISATFQIRSKSVTYKSMVTAKYQTPAANFDEIVNFASFQG